MVWGSGSRRSPRFHRMVKVQVPQGSTLTRFQVPQRVDIKVQVPEGAHKRSTLKRFYVPQRFQIKAQRLQKSRQRLHTMFQSLHIKLPGTCSKITR